MYTHTLKKLPKGTFEITVKMPWAMIEKETEKAFQTLAEMLEVEGYRKGKAPKELAKKQIKKEAIYQQIIRTLFPDIYAEIIKKEELKPVISPRVDLKQAKENEDWELVFTLAEKPSVKLGDYIKVLHKDYHYEGEVTEMNYFFVHIKTSNNQIITIPNSHFFDRSFSVKDNEKKTNS